jgi:hypothetical protein
MEQLRGGFMRFRNVALLFAFVAFIGSVASADSVKGTLTVGEKLIELNKIYAEYVDDPNCEGEQVLMLRLSDMELPGTKKSVLRAQAEAGKLNVVEFILDAEKKITTLLILSNAFEEGSFYSAETYGEPQNITIGPDAVRGTVAIKEETEGQKWEVQADIEVTLPAKE